MLGVSTISYPSTIYRGEARLRTRSIPGPTAHTHSSPTLCPHRREISAGPAFHIRVDSRSDNLCTCFSTAVAIEKSGKKTLREQLVATLRGERPLLVGQRASDLLDASWPAVMPSHLRNVAARALWVWHLLSVWHGGDKFTASLT